MKVRRLVSVYSTINDKLIEEIYIDNVPIVELRKILNIEKDDLEVYKVYLISNEQLSGLINYVPELKKIEIKDVELFVECYQE